ncbi:Uncharacterized protein QTN25_003588 [Entamoeba marina]
MSKQQKTTSRRQKGQKIESGAFGYTPNEENINTGSRQTNRKQNTQQSMNSSRGQQQYQNRRGNANRNQNNGHYRKDKFMKQHPTSIPIGVGREYFIDSPAFTPDTYEWMQTNDVKTVLYAAMEAIQSPFIYKEQYYEISLKASIPSNTPTPAHIFAHFHKSLDDCIIRYYPHTHHWPFESVGVLPSKTTTISNYQLSQGISDDFMSLGELHKSDAALRLEEILMVTLFFNDIRLLEIVTNENKSFLTPDVSKLFERKKTALCGEVVKAISKNIVDVLDKSKGRKLVGRIFSIFPDASKVQVANAVIENLLVGGVETTHTQNIERSAVLRQIASFISEVVDPVQVIEYIGQLCEIMDENGVALLNGDGFMFVQAVLLNKSLRSEEPDYYEEFYDKCCEVFEEYQKLENPSRVVIDFITQLKSI